MSNSRAPQAILFDLDGTLIDSFHLYLEAYRRALTPYLGRRPELEDFVARRPSAERAFLAEWIGAEDADECHAAMCRHYSDLFPSLSEGVYDGVPEMLAALRAAGYPLGIVTGKGRALWEVTQGAIPLGDFDVVVTEDDVQHVKPDPAGLLLAASRLGVDVEAAVYIGDSPSDLEAGRQAGMRIGAALWPKSAEGEKEQFIEAVQALRPDWLFERAAAVTRELAGWC
ncbi:pyrophosphatase PpaX [soil metagenome]